MKIISDVSFRRFACLATLTGLVLSLAAHPAAAADLRWVPSPSPSVVGYKLYVGSDPGFFAADQVDHVVDIGSDYGMNDGVASHPLENLISEPSWVVLTAYDEMGSESPPSNQMLRELPTVCASDTDCRDADVCNGEEYCENGTCTAGVAPQCNTVDPCNVGRCDPVYGCATDPAPNGTSCNDGDSETVGDRCEAGSCYGEVPVIPEPGDYASPNATFISFEQSAAGDDPTGWFDTGASNSFGESDLFEIMALSDGDKVFGTRSTATNIHSHLLIDGSDRWSNYELSGRLGVSEAKGGIGVTLYSGYPNTDTYYRLRRYNTGSFHFSHHGGDADACVGDTDTGVTPTAGVWYHFRFRAFEDDDGTRVQAKVWPAVDQEPSTWQADCLDASSTRLLGGAPGLWSMGAGEKHWDDLAVVPVQGSLPIPVPPEAPECLSDDDCSDDDLCSGVERCVAGSCAAGEAPVCPEAGVCGVSRCYAFLGCVIEPVENGTVCGDGDACNAVDTCNEGACTAGSSLSCPAPSVCRVGHCDPISGCGSTPIPDGSYCDDGNSSTVQDFCSSGVCLGSVPSPPDPDDPNDEPPTDEEMPVEELESVLFDFENVAPGSNPPGWLDTKRKNSLEEADHFSVFELDDGSHVYGTTSRRINIHSHYVADSSVDWFDYEYRGRMMVEQASSGIGVTLYSDYPNSDSYYRLRHYGSRPFHLANHPDGEGVCEGITTTNVVPAANTWYVFRMQAFDDQSKTRVRAMVWAMGEQPPQDWQIDCLAPTDASYFSGSPGLWSQGRDGKFWDDLEVIGLDSSQLP